MTGYLFGVVGLLACVVGFLATRKSDTSGLGMLVAVGCFWAGLTDACAMLLLLIARAPAYIAVWPAFLLGVLAVWAVRKLGF